MNSTLQPAEPPITILSASRALAYQKKTIPPSPPTLPYPTHPPYSSAIMLHPCPPSPRPPHTGLSHGLWHLQRRQQQRQQHWDPVEAAQHQRGQRHQPHQAQPGQGLQKTCEAFWRKSPESESPTSGKFRARLLSPNRPGTEILREPRLATLDVRREREQSAGLRSAC